MKPGEMGEKHEAEEINGWGKVENPCITAVKRLLSRYQITVSTPYFPVYFQWHWYPRNRISIYNRKLFIERILRVYEPKTIIHSYESPRMLRDPVYDSVKTFINMTWITYDVLEDKYNMLFTTTNMVTEVLLLICRGKWEIGHRDDINDALW